MGVGTPGNRKQELVVRDRNARGEECGGRALLRMTRTGEVSRDGKIKGK